MGRVSIHSDEPEWFKKWARRQVRSALRSGRLVRPEACSLCGETGRKIHAHHEDYRKPFEVEWLCSKCHGIRHTRLVQLLRFTFDIFGVGEVNRG